MSIIKNAAPVVDVEFQFSPDGSLEESHWVSFGSILSGGVPIIADGRNEGDDETFMGRYRVCFVEGACWEFETQDAGIDEPEITQAEKAAHYDTGSGNAD